MQKFVKNQIFKDDFSSQEDAKGIKFDVIRKLYLSATNNLETFFMKLKWLGATTNRRRACKMIYFSRIYPGFGLEGLITIKTNLHLTICD